MKTALTGPVRVRFPPSPTGFLHVGGARTAIYNELLRKSLGGALVLRIEDTDRQRSDEAMTRQIQSALRWLGVEWDEGPFLQSDHVERHREVAQRLVEEGKAYRCFCTPETLDGLRAEAQKAGTALRYPRTCLGLSQEEQQRRIDAGEAFAVRFKMPDEPIRFHDLVRGDMEIGADILDDYILLRSDGSPTYHLSVCVDDADMKISHVLRGEDHLVNTAKHVPLFAAMGGPVPTFGHLPMILGPDRKRLSKRSGAASVEEFRDQGILPQALYNYLVLLGWSPGDDREIMTREEITEAFTVERLNSAAAVFDPEKLAWMNGQYMSSVEIDELLEHMTPFLEAVGLGGLEGEAAGRLRTVVALHRGRARTLKELAPMLTCYFQDQLDYDPDICAKFLQNPELPGHLRQLRERYEALPEFTIDPLDQTLRQLSEELEIKAGVLIHPTRMALSGAKAGPPLFDLVEAMGRDATARHLDRFIAYLEESIE
jgi:glutamyl-tRNA synthetase